MCFCSRSHRCVWLFFGGGMQLSACIRFRSRCSQIMCRHVLVFSRSGLTLWVPQYFSNLKENTVDVYMRCVRLASPNAAGSMLHGPHLHSPFRLHRNALLVLFLSARSWARWPTCPATSCPCSRSRALAAAAPWVSALKCQQRRIAPCVRRCRGRGSVALPRAHQCAPSIGSVCCFA